MPSLICFRPCKPYNFCVDMILATCHHHHTLISMMIMERGLHQITICHFYHCHFWSLQLITTPDDYYLIIPSPEHFNERCKLRACSVFSDPGMRSQNFWLVSKLEIPMVPTSALWFRNEKSKLLIGPFYLVPTSALWFRKLWLHVTPGEQPETETRGRQNKQKVRVLYILHLHRQR